MIQLHKTKLVLSKFKGCRMGRSDKVSLYVSLLINTRFRFFFFFLF